MPERIDAFTHVLPPAFFDAMRDAHPTDALENLFFEELWDVDARLSVMDEYGIDRQVVTLAQPPVWRGLTATEALPLVRVANDEVAAFAAAHPDRFIPVGTLPFVGDAYLAEFERCIDDLGMVGVQVFTNVDGRPIDGPEHEAVFAEAANRGVPVWLHPQLYEWYDWLPEYGLHRILGWPFDTGVALARLAISGILDRHPDLAVIAHHMGGVLPHFGDRVETFYEARVQNPDLYPDLSWPDLDAPIGDLLSRFYGDTAVNGSRGTLECGRSFLGDSRLVFGTDYPFGPDRGRRFVRQTVDLVAGVEDAEVRHGVFAGNLRSLLD